MIVGALALAAALAAPSPGRIVVFAQPGSLAARDFDQRVLPRLRALAAERGLTIDILEAAKGAPGEVHVTPLLVYQDVEGRSIFRGRYADVDRFAQFLRTVKAGPLAGTSTRHENAAVWRRGRAVIIAPLKITALTGTMPPRYDENAFLDRARRSVMAGFTRFRYQREVETGPSDRMFYMDFYPYRAPDGALYVSTAIFSGFDCVDPVFVRFDEPVKGTWDRLEEAFRRAGRLLEDEVAQLVVGSKLGDAFDPVASGVPDASWEALGLALPPAPARAEPVSRVRAALGTRWSVEEASSLDPPRLTFRFSPPLDSYNGEVRAIGGEVTLAQRGALAGAVAKLTVRTASITMGNKTLDAELKDKMLRVASFPTAEFVLDPLSPATAPLTYGAPVPFTGTGRFEMLGQSIPIAVNAQAEPVMGEDGAPRLEVRATFRLRIGDPFGLKGPDGPSPANDTLFFDVRLRLKPY